MPEQPQQQVDQQLFTIQNFAKRHQAFVTEAAVRAQRFDARGADRYGFGRAGAFVQVGRRVLIHERRYFAAILSPKPTAEKQRRAPKPKGKARIAARGGVNE